MNKNKIYFPQDERLNLFCVSSSSTGIVVPLAPFGYPRIHLTFFIRQMSNKKGFQKLVFHLKNEQTNETIKEYFLEFDEEKIKQDYAEKFKKWWENQLQIIQKYIVIEKQLGKKHIICYDCAVNEHIRKHPINQREKASKSYSKLLKKIERKNFQIIPCTNKKHKVLIDLNSGQMYGKSESGYIRYSDKEKMFAESMVAFDEIFEEEIKWLDRLTKDFSKSLEAYKAK